MHHASPYIKHMMAEVHQLPDEFGVACMLKFGYRIDKKGSKTRQNLNNITQWY